MSLKTCRFPCHSVTTEFTPSDIRELRAARSERRLAVRLVPNDSIKGRYLAGGEKSGAILSIPQTSVTRNR